MQQAPEALSPALDGSTPPNRADSDRGAQRGAGGLYADKWPNTKVALVANMAAKGYSATTIAEVLNDGTGGNAIAHMVNMWGISQESDDPRQTYANVPVPLAAKHRTQLAAEAQRRGMELPELMQKIAVMLIRDDLFGAVLDG